MKLYSKLNRLFDSVKGDIRVSAKYGDKFTIENKENYEGQTDMTITIEDWINIRIRKMDSIFKISLSKVLRITKTEIVDIKLKSDKGYKIYNSDDGYGDDTLTFKKPLFNIKNENVDMTVCEDDLMEWIEFVFKKYKLFDKIFKEFGIPNKKEVRGDDAD